MLMAAVYPARRAANRARLEGRRGEAAEVGEPAQRAHPAPGPVGLERGAPVGTLVLNPDNCGSVEQSLLGGARVHQHLGQRIDVSDLVAGDVERGDEVEVLTLNFDTLRDLLDESEATRDEFHRIADERQKQNMELRGGVR